MLKTLVFVGAIAALSTPAFAEGIKIDLTGKSSSEIQSAIAQAAQKVCAEADREASPHYTSTTASCVTWAIANANAQLPKQLASLK